MTRRFGSDVMVDAIKACGFPYVALNPGSSYRGLHDSLVNCGANEPEILTCNHEKLAVGIAHGYAKASGRRWPRSSTTSSGCCTTRWGSTTPTSTARRSSSSAGPGRRPTTAGGRTSLDPHGERAGQRRARLHEVGRPAGVDRLGSREHHARPSHRDRRAAGPGLRRARRRAAGGRARRRCGAAALGAPAHARADRPGAGRARGPRAAARRRRAPGLRSRPARRSSTSGSTTSAPPGRAGAPRANATPPSRRSPRRGWRPSCGRPGRLVVDLQPDGDLMFDLGALWIAAYHRIPMLAVMFNNRAYHNDREHQERIARHRGTDVARAYIGMQIDRPAPDFAAVARGLGWHGEGPIDDPDAVQAAVRQAAAVVVEQGRPALVDVVCRPE